MKNKKTQKLLSGLAVSLCVLVLSPPVSFANLAPDKRYYVWNYKVVDEINKAKENGDNAKALNLLNEAATDGNALAQVWLAKTYYFGEYNVDKDLNKSFALTKELAFKGYGQAQDFLAIHYAFGHGVEKNLINALKWSILALKNPWVPLLSERLISRNTDNIKMIEDAIKLYKSKMPDWAIIQAKEKARECHESKYNYCKEDYLGSKSSTKEDKLKQAKELFDNGLLTNSVYEELKADILGLN